MKQEIKEGAAPVEATSAEGFALKVGHTYISRDGKERFTVIAIDPDPEIALPVHTKREATGGSVYYDFDGKFVPARGPQDDWDLVAEAMLEVRTPAPFPEPAEAAPAGAEQIAELLEAAKAIAEAPAFVDPKTNPPILTVSIAQKNMDRFRAALTKAQGSR